MHGNFAWYELMTTDVPAAEAFYGAVVGWTARSAAEGSSYTIFSAGGHGVAGMLPLREDQLAGGARPAWIGYVLVDEVDAAVAELTRAGGTVHRPPADVPGMVRFSVVADPQGVVFVVFTPEAGMEGPPPPPPGTAGHFGWRELVTTDWEAAFAFYSGLFGWTKAMSVDMGGMGTYQTFGVRGGEPIGGMMTKPPGMPGPPLWAYYINVDSVEAAIGRLKAAGGTLVSGPHEVPGPMYVAQGLDPQGAVVSLLSAKP